MKIKIIIFIICFFLMTVYCQCFQNNRLNTPRTILDCEELTLNTIEILSEYLTNNQYDSTETIITEWVRQCGISECSQRLIILKAILNKEPFIEATNFYFLQDFHYEFKKRIQDSRENNYQNTYSENKYYYKYVPLRHRIDSIVMKKSNELLKSNSLTPDEILICTLFSGNIEEFDDIITKDEFKQSNVKKFIKESIFNNNSQHIFITLCTGVYSPIDANNIFSYRPILGMSLNSFISKKVYGEFILKSRIKIGANDYSFIHSGDTNTINSASGCFVGLMYGYKLYENDTYIILPKIGIGLEMLDFVITKRNNSTEYKEDYNKKYLHLSLGVSVMRAISLTNYIGLEMYYHFCPFKFDEKLHTKFYNSSFSLEISYKLWKFL